jgi:hypothetical protein
LERQDKASRVSAMNDLDMFQKTRRGVAALAKKHRYDEILQAAKSLETIPA